MQQTLHRPCRDERSGGTQGGDSPRSLAPGTADAAPLSDEGPLLAAETLQTLRDLSGEDDQEFFVEVIQLFLTDSLSLVATIRQAVLDRDPRRLLPAAHSLRSSSGNVGAVGLSAVCRALEYAAATRAIAEAEALLPRLERLYPLVCQALKVECERTQS